MSKYTDSFSYITENVHRDQYKGVLAAVICWQGFKGNIKNVLKDIKENMIIMN